MMRKVLLVMLVASSACHSKGDPACSCSPGWLYINTNGSDVQELRVGGPACTPADVHSGFEYDEVGFVPGASVYTVIPSTEGDCSVTVVLSDGTSLEKTVRFSVATGGGCCGTARDGARALFTTEAFWDLPYSSPADSGAD